MRIDFGSHVSMVQINDELFNIHSIQFSMRKFTGCFTKIMFFDSIVMLFVFNGLIS